MHEIHQSYHIRMFSGVFQQKKILFEGLKVKLRLAHILKDNILVCWTLERMQVKRPSH